VIIRRATSFTTTPHDTRPSAAWQSGSSTCDHPLARVTPLSSDFHHRAALGEQLAAGNLVSSGTLDLLDLQLAGVCSEYERLSALPVQQPDEVHQLIAWLDALFEAWTALVAEFLIEPSLIPEMSPERRAIGPRLHRLAVLRSKVIALQLTAHGVPVPRRGG
jgi:hypothetical protein